MAWGEPIVNTRTSTIVRAHLYYRGKDAIQLSAHATLENVARLLWDSGVQPFFPTVAPVLDVAGETRSGGIQARVYAAMAHAAAEGRS